jgi:N-acetyl-gamma-glutamyl-phosphate reductase
MRENAINCAVLGASGYTGAELMRILATHPRFRVTAATADRKAGQPLADVFPHLSHLGLTLTALSEVDFDAVDLIFCALPHTTTQALIAGLPERLKIVDLSADFRLADSDRYAEWYGRPHLAPALQKSAVYGLPEIYRAQIKAARLVANTGCYVATALIPLIPLLRDRVIDPASIIIDAKSGVSGAGRGLKEAMLFCEVADGFNAYGVGNHRHMAELDQELSKAAGVDIRPTFTPHLLPQNRGILATIYVQGDAEKIDAVWRKTYGNEPFVRLRPLGQTPATRHVRGSNFIDLGVASDRAPGRAIIVSTLDNLVKGAAGQAIQNANLVMGLDETTGLMLAPVFP